MKTLLQDNSANISIISKADVITLIQSVENVEIIKC